MRGGEKFPFTEKPLKGKIFLREFKESVKSEELIWHRDAEDRIVEVVSVGNWWFQYDEKEPFKLQEGMRFKIEALTWHRIIKQSGDLTVKIIKM